MTKLNYTMRYDSIRSVLLRCIRQGEGAEMKYTINKPAGATTVEIQSDGDLRVTTVGFGRDIVRIFENPYANTLDALKTGLQQWVNGELLQDALPDASTNFREALINPHFGLSKENVVAHLSTNVPTPITQRISLEETGCARCGETEDMSEFSDLCGYCEHMAEKTINDA